MLMLVIYSFGGFEAGDGVGGMVGVGTWRALSGYRHDERSGTGRQLPPARGDDGGGARALSPRW